MDILNLTIKDDSNQIQLFVPKNTLIKLNNYFRNLLTSGFKEEKQNEITIIVPNVQICKNIVCLVPFKSNDIYHIYEYVKCLDYWNMDFDFTLIDGISINKEDFDIVFEIADIVGYHYRLVQIISDNLPKDYDLENFSEHLIIEIVKKMDRESSKQFYSFGISMDDIYPPGMTKESADVHKYIDIASEKGYVNILQWFKKSGFDFGYGYYGYMDSASKNNHIDVLDWFKNSGIDVPFAYSNLAIDKASRNGHIDVLDWFLNSGCEFRYTHQAINWASENGHIHILDWFFKKAYQPGNRSEHHRESDSPINYKLKFKYTCDAIDYASKNNHVAVLDWFKTSGLEFKYTKRAINYASENNHVSVLEWFKTSGLEFKCTQEAIW